MSQTPTRPPSVAACSVGSPNSLNLLGQNASFILITKIKEFYVALNKQLSDSEQVKEFHTRPACWHTSKAIVNSEERV
jgi:hypothetical protein